MKTLKVIFLWVLSMVFVLLIVQNTAPVRAHFLWLMADFPIFLLLLFAGAVGFISGLFIGLPMKRASQESAQPVNRKVSQGGIPAPEQIR